jgi:hypothetical protein
MKSQIQILQTLLILLPFFGIGQDLKSNLFLRTPQVVNYNFTQNEISYTPVISVGAGLSHKSKFIELATFISDGDVYGYYTFFGTTLKTKDLDTNWKLHTNWFGEVAYIPEQQSNADAFTYTTGLCFFLNYSFDWGSIGFPFCVGAAYSTNTISLNTRTILNLSISF